MSHAITTTIVLGAFALLACASRADTAPAEPVVVGPAPESVLVDPSPEQEPTPTAELTNATGDLKLTLATMGDFTTFLRLVDQAGLSDMLVGSDLVTVFVPTDAAFAALPAGQLDALMSDRDELIKFVHYHMLAGRLTGRELVDLKRQPTMSGAEVEVNASNTGTPERVMIDRATIVMPNLKATNGVIHVLDAPLMPPERAKIRKPGKR